jgi:hypothetical protein
MLSAIAMSGIASLLQKAGLSYNEALINSTGWATDHELGRQGWKYDIKLALSLNLI